MKKIISLILSAVMLFSLTACGSHPLDGGDTAIVEPVAFDKGTPAGAVLAAFIDAVNAGGWTDMEELGNKINALGAIPLELASVKVEQGYLNGFTAEITDFTDGAMLAPWIGSIPFVCYVFVPGEGINPDTFINGLKAVADLRWNICTEADEMAYTVSKGIVCFVMAPASFDE